MGMDENILTISLISISNSFSPLSKKQKAEKSDFGIKFHVIEKESKLDKDEKSDFDLESDFFDIGY